MPGFTLKSKKITETPAELRDLATPQEMAVTIKPGPVTTQSKAALSFTPMFAKKVVEAPAPKGKKLQLPSTTASEKLEAAVASVASVPVPASASASAEAKTEAKAEEANEEANSNNDSIAESNLESNAEADDELTLLGEGFVQEELDDPYLHPPPAGYIPQTHRNFAKFIKMTYADFMLTEQAATIQPGEKYPYQRFIREYMRQASPYRGVLVYHGLGSGKTCTAIACAEALYATAGKKIIVMTPFSLRKNFLKEVSFCGFRHFRLQNFWTALEKENPEHRLFGTEILGLSENYIRTAKKIWVPDFSQTEPNYESLTSEEQTEIRKQILSQLVWDKEKNPTGRIRFINYNGVSAAKLKRLACEDPTFFNDAVIVVDEIHNLIRLMQGTIDPYLKDLPKMKRKVPKEPVEIGQWSPTLCKAEKNYKRGYLFYRMFLAAKNSKIIGLSGTPLINFPEELGILANVLHGYIPLLKGTIEQAGDKAEAELLRILKAHPNVDFINVEKSKQQLAGTEVTVTLLPEGIQNMEGQEGVERTEGGPSYAQIQQSVLEAIKAGGFKFRGEVKLEAVPLLHPFGEEFRADFLTPDGLTVKNKLVLGKRLTGLVSYYKGSRQDLMPSVASDEVIRVPFSPYAQAMYSVARLEEVQMEMKKDKQGKGGLGDVWGEVYEIGAMAKSSNYKMGSRQLCNFAFPDAVTRPKARNKQELESENGLDADIVDAVIEDEAADAEVFPELEEENDDVATVAEEDANDREEEEEEQAGGAPGDKVEKKLLKAEGRELTGMKKVMQKIRDEGNMIPVLSVGYNAKRAAEKAGLSDDEAFKASIDAQDKFTQLVKSGKTDEEAAAELGFSLGPVVSEIAAIDKGAKKQAAKDKKDKKYFDDNDDEDAPASAAPAPAAPAPAAPAPAAKGKSLKVLLAEKKKKEEEAKAKAEAEAQLDTLAVKPKGKSLKELKEEKEQKAAAAAEAPLYCKGGIREGETYKDALQRAKECLRKLQTGALILSDEEESLKKYSPKFAAILERILAAPGSSLLYSQFLDMEGIGIFRLVMDLNGFAPIEIVSTPTGPAFTPESEASLRKGPYSEGSAEGQGPSNGQARYITFSGEEKEDVRRLALDVFNAKFDELPGNLKKVLQESGYTNNHTGQLCRVFCITSAGAEGLSLKNVRAVHIMEPYWNDVRLRQVKGRAIRIGSHLELPEDQRNVSIYTYISVFGEEAQGGKNPDIKVDETIRLRDKVERKEALSFGLPIAATAPAYVLTSDERLYVISERKKKVIEDLENVMKSAAVDCELNIAENKDGSFQCLNLENVVGDFLYQPELKADIAKSEYTYKEVKRVVIPIKYKGREFWAAANRDDKGKITGFTLYAKEDMVLQTPLGTTGVKDDKPAAPIVVTIS